MKLSYLTLLPFLTTPILADGHPHSPTWCQMYHDSECKNRAHKVSFNAGNLNTFHGNGAKYMSCNSKLFLRKGRWYVHLKRCLDDQCTKEAGPFLLVQVTNWKTPKPGKLCIDVSEGLKEPAEFYAFHGAGADGLLKWWRDPLVNKGGHGGYGE